jgi:hypothetical protein
VSGSSPSSFARSVDLLCLWTLRHWVAVESKGRPPGIPGFTVNRAAAPRSCFVHVPRPHTLRWGAPPVWFLFLFAASPGTVDSNKASHGPVLFRPQVFSPSRRFLPLPDSKPFSWPLPRPGLTRFLQVFPRDPAAVWLFRSRSLGCLPLFRAAKDLSYSIFLLRSKGKRKNPSVLTLRPKL